MMNNELFALFFSFNHNLQHRHPLSLELYVILKDIIDGSFRSNIYHVSTMM